ncbi:hypothetical protein [Glutamicibacter sp. PS]|uniref:hypothetical protein n=1 Tax=Glutamicibacter sp. PS TaxID=3075634 RepID=UPI00283D493B|nr:hypothetical protein [Glutamicibacter sp. PS]MDR4532405.1 hypothetical protein [Glutamicibacter sp. PS]
MTQRAPRRIQKSAFPGTAPVVEGSAARAARPEPVPAADLQFAETKRRVTLSLVPKLDQNNRRSLIVMFSILVALAVAVVVTLVLLNTTVAQRQYEIVSLRGQERALSQENQALLKEAQSLSAPQALAKEAKELGLVAPGAPGLVNLDQNKISREAKAATKPEDGTKYVNLPLPGEALKAKAEAKEKELAAKKEAEAKAEADAKAAAKGSEEKAKASKAATERAQKDGRPVFTEGELNGGTIPAPSLSTPTS